MIYYVILNPNNANAELLKHVNGVPAKFRQKKMAILSGEDAIGDGTYFEYQVVEACDY